MSRPVLRFELSHLRVSVFENAKDDRAPQYSISVSRRYYSREEDCWKTMSVSLNPADVPSVIRLLQATESELISSRFNQTNEEEVAP